MAGSVLRIRLPPVTPRMFSWWYWDMRQKSTLEREWSVSENVVSLIKKKIKFSSYIRKFRGIGCEVIYVINDLLMMETCICAFPHVLGSPSPYMTLHPILSEFPYIWGKFSFLFYHCCILKQASKRGNVLFLSPLWHFFFCRGGSYCLLFQYPDPNPYAVRVGEIWILNILLLNTDPTFWLTLLYSYLYIFYIFYSILNVDIDSSPGVYG